MNKVPCTITTTTTRQYRFTLEDFRKYLNIPSSFEIIDIKLDDDTGSKYDQVWVETRQFTTQQLRDRLFTQKEEEGTIQQSEVDQAIIKRRKARG